MSDFKFIALAFLGLLFAGCGKSNSNPAQNAAGNPGNPATPNNPNEQLANDGTNRVGAGNKESPVGSTSSGLEDSGSVMDADSMEIADEKIVTELAGIAVEQPVPVFEVSEIPKGLTSSSLEIVDNSSSSSGNQSSEATNRTPQPVVNQIDQSVGFTLPAGFHSVSNSDIDAETGLPFRITHERDSVVMALIPPGVFIRGVDGKGPEVGPRHAVLLEDPYYIDITEVTIDQYERFREFYRKSEGRRFDPPVNQDAGPDMPALGIKFLDAKFYAKWTGKVLPTESQWERAARGDSGFDYPWGNGRPIFPAVYEPGQIHTVASFPGDLSPMGVYDMSGNGREWCLDIFVPDQYQRELAESPVPLRNPTGPKSFQGKKLQVVRGGIQSWEVWQRFGVAQNETLPDIGFRCVLNISSTESGGSRENPNSKSKSIESTKPGEKRKSPML